jgi:hypothetical protein
MGILAKAKKSLVIDSFSNKKRKHSENKLGFLNFMNFSCQYPFNDCIMLLCAYNSLITDLVSLLERGEKTLKTSKMANQLKDDIFKMCLLVL